MRRLIFIIGIVMTALCVGAQTVNTFGDLRAKVLHVGQKLTGQNTTNDQAVAVIVRELANNYQGRLSRQQFQELKDTIEGMRKRFAQDTWQTVFNSAIGTLQAKTDTLDIQQRILDYYRKAPQEQIYVHTDRPYYVSGDTVWLRAHLVDAVTHTPISRSHYVYVELHDQQADTLLQRIIMKCDSDGVFANALVLPRDLKGGCYTLAAYTQWMRNFPAKRFFYKALRVVGAPSRTVSECEVDGLPVRTRRTARAQGTDPTLGLGQRKGHLLIQLNKATDEPLSCVLYGSGNLIVTDYTPGKVLRIDSKTLRPGSLSVAMVNRETGAIIAEQQTTIEGAAPQVTISGKVGTQNAPMQIDIDLADADGTPLHGNFSLSVTDYDVVKPDTMQPAIDKYLNLQPADYSLAKILNGTFPAIDYGFETQQLITGRIKGTLLSHIKNPHLWVLNCNTGERKEFELGDSTRFALAVDNPEGTVFTLEGTRSKGGKAFTELKVDPVSYPNVTLPHYTSAQDVDLSAFQAQAQSELMYNQQDYTKLPEVVKTAKKHQPLRSNYLGIEAPRGYQAGDPRIDHAVTMQQLLLQLGMRIETNSEGDQYVTTPDRAGVQMYLENFSVPIDEHCNILALPPTDVRSIEYFTPNNAINGFFGVRPKSYTGKVPGVLFIFLKDGSEITRARAMDFPSVATVRQQGYRRPVEFYSPQYTNLSDKTRPDHRTTLYWNPKVETDANGHATVRFYASDVSKRYLVTLEGVSDDGIIVQKKMIVE